jgi:regulator of CtrA degradation
LAFFDKTYSEALALTEETYAYLSEINHDDIDVDSPTENLCLRCEAFRLTTRLMQVVAWLLTQRAVHAGELTAASTAA